MIPFLTIAIPTVRGREKKLAELLSVLHPQLSKDIELLVAHDNKEISIGKKRQQLLEAATGDYFAMIDDDDLVATDFVATCKKHLPGNDCLGHLSLYTEDDLNPQFVRHSSRYKEWGDSMDGVRFTRLIEQKCPHRRTLALLTGFSDLRFGEDRDYSLRLARLLQKEAYVEKVLYFHRYESSDSFNDSFNKKYGIQ